MDELTRLALEARAGIEGAARRLVERTYPEVRRLCASIVDAESAPDLAQETYLRALAALPRFRADSSLRTWLLSIAHRVCADELRLRSRRRRRDRSLQWSSSAAPAADWSDPSEHVSVRDLIARLDRDRRAAFLLTQVLGMSYRDAADVCGCPAGTIRSRVFRARDDLIGALGESEPSASNAS